MPLKSSNLQIPPPENGERFEELCLDLYKAEFGDKTQKNGRQGQSQNGVDIFVSDQHIGIQCKKREFDKRVTETELREEVKKAKNFRPLLQRFILATTCKRDTIIQKTARLVSENHRKQNLFSVEIHSWEEIKSLLDTHPDVYEKYYPNFQKAPSITPSIISSIQSESRHQELNRIRYFIDKDKPITVLELLENFKKEKWAQLEDKEKYRVLNNMAWAKIRMRQEIQASELLIKALQFNKEDEKANANCALAYFIIGDTKNSKKYIEKTKQLNSLNIMAYILEIQIKDKENQYLRDIVSAIPQNIKTKHQIAHVLSQISIKRKQYAEAKKWLNIFYNAREQDKGWKDIMDEADYAYMSLSLILAKQDIFSGKRIPDNLNHKLEEIIKIYKKLVTASQYSELREFNPNWHLHYAQALELSGNLGEAISVLQTGVQKFPNDDDLKIELSRLFTQEGDIAQGISILEKRLGLQSLASEDSSVSVNKKPLASNQDISEKSFNLALILADLYFHNKQSEKAWELLDKIQEAPSISESDRLNARQYGIFRRINFGEIDKAEEILNPLFEKHRDNIFNLILKSKIESAKEKALEGQAKNSKDHRDKKIQYLKKAYNVFNDKQCNEEVNRNSLYFESKERLRNIQLLFKELYQSKMYKEAEPLLEKITNQNLNHPEIFKLLHTYFENGKNRLAIDLAEALLKKFPDRIESVNILFLIYVGLGDKKKAIQYYKNFLKSNPKNDFIRIELALAYLRNENITEAKELLIYPFNLNKLSVEQSSQLSIAYKLTGDYKKALETQYQCVKNNPKRLEPQSVYFELFTFLNHPGLFDILNVEKESKAPKPAEYKPDNNIFLRPKKVGMDCYIRIKDIESLEETEIIIEKEADIYTPNHELSQALLEKKAGDIILFFNKKYQIMKIKSKYNYKYGEIVKEAEKRFASKTFLKSVHIPKSADAKKILQTLEKKLSDISKQQEGLDKLFQFYSDGKATVGSIAKISGKHPIEIIGELIFSQTDKFISAIPAWENDNKTQELLDEKTSILIDFSSLIMIHQLKLEKYMEESKFKLHVCQSTIDSLKKYIQEMALHSKDGRLTLGFDKEGHFRKSFVQAKIIKQDLNFWMKIKIWAEKHCQIKPISADIVLSREQRREKEKILGKEFFDPLLAAGGNVTLLCEDAILRKFAEHEFSVSGARLFDLIEYFEKQVIIDNNQAVKFKAQLVQLNQTYIPIDHNILLFLLKEAEYSVNDTGFQRGLFFLSPVSDLPGVVNVVANFLIEICQSSSLLLYNKQVITRELLNKASFGREESLKQIAYQIIQLVQVRTQFLPILQNEILGHIMEWLKGKIY